MDKAGGKYFFTVPPYCMRLSPLPSRHMVIGNRTKIKAVGLSILMVVHRFDYPTTVLKEGPRDYHVKIVGSLM